MESLAALESEIVGCRSCARLVAWREKVGREKRAAFRDDDYWARPIPSFGDDPARILIVGLAPAAHGANRTGRVFTGDRSADFLVAGMHRVGIASQPNSDRVDDGLRLIGCRMTAAVRCAPPQNAPTPAERTACRPYLVRELALVRPRVILALGGLAWQETLRTAFEKVDFIALPTMQSTPPVIPPALEIGILEARMLILQNTVAVNFAGNPALAVPVPLRHASVPVTSLQLIGPPRHEAELLNAGRLVESAVKE